MLGAWRRHAGTCRQARLLAAAVLARYAVDTLRGWADMTQLRIAQRARHEVHSRLSAVGGRPLQMVPADASRGRTCHASYMHDCNNGLPMLRGMPWTPLSCFVLLRHGPANKGWRNLPQC